MSAIPKDRFRLLELTVTALSFYSLYNMTVTNFGNLDALADASMPLIVSQFLQHLILTFVQGFFIYRIHKLTGITLISVVASILLALRLLAATAVQALATVSLHEEKNNIVEYVNKYFWITVVKDMLGVATDTFIAAVLLMRLFRERSEAMDQTLPVVDKLILYTVETGFATGCYTILIAVLLLTMKHNYIWIGIWLLSSKVFSNTLLANLNSRASLRTQMHTTVESISRLEIEFGAGSDIVPLGTRLSSADAHLVTLDHRDSVLDAGTTSTHEDIKMMRKTETFASPP
ncbi:hypothetical protein VKT23_016194 [Stygiomarasmius scandens]|uniref:DUF6534 domain-containing protein n=1 Tax=Marasmiellus scandens TaxID=2682957 RepID=A0ABR1IYI9_9AGAR